ncbi:hypothetical protein K2173_008753 [Erythroxylum novogranatense]|uniref:Uncharacterized protein n=1 Tax=Erythroxylum novogranatense TaxID=1862640 RepID=A0AAV8S5I3_9ROSI|nr:hypothetical protein K2173_008753 [Erythroxylum novogranatense]
MGEVLFVLEQNLTSQKEKLTPQEENILQTCKSKAVRDFTVGSLVGGAIAWAATSKLSKFARVNFAGGAAAFLGFWKFGRSLDSCVDHILALDGTRLQRELANIISRQYRDNPSIMQYMHRHFYSEKVFDDSNSDKPILRWRYRNFFGDNVDHGQTRNESNSASSSDSPRDSDVKRAGQIPMNPVADAMEDPLDSIFGYMAPLEEIHHYSTSSSSSRASTGNRRRSQRRRRTHHHEDS